MTSKAAKRQAKRYARKIEPIKARKPAHGSITAPKTEKTASKAYRVRKSGLMWLWEKRNAYGERRISNEQLAIGRRYGEICSEALRVQMPAKCGMEGSGGGFGSKSIGEETFKALRDKYAADAAILRALPGDYGKAMIDLLENVCHHGVNLREMAYAQIFKEQKTGDMGDAPAPSKVHERAIVLEERLKAGLSVAKASLNQIEYAAEQEPQNAAA